MTNQHPITPPPELVQEWIDLPLSREEILATAYRAGADQELEACAKWVEANFGHLPTRHLHHFRRPKPSLKEQALAALNVIEDKTLGPTNEEKLIRRALEQLDD
jgi:hypothetical protein